MPERSQPAPSRLAPPTRITRSARYKGGVFSLPDIHDDGSGAAITVDGDNLTVDFGGAVLRGSPETTEPDRRSGCAILVRGKNVTIKNVVLRGYKFGIIARDCPGLRLENVDASYLYKPRLKSTPEREDLADWMSFHQNEKDEWLKFGAAFSLSGCEKFSVRKCRAVGGGCGLMLTRCTGGDILGNDFSFLSAIGLGLYRSSKNRIQQNKIDFCVRGYSHGVYNRGQDSAGILIFEQSGDNVFAYNSVTHGGDGFFLWAGQTTMDTGKGGCDNNLLYGNDFSHAPTNGIEATFSKNRFERNLILECWHGVWGGYSYDTEIVGNTFGFNADAIAIEHGRKNTIARNTFFRNRTGVRLWQNARQDPNWGYVKFHETDSRDYLLTDNTIDESAKWTVISATPNVVERGTKETPERRGPATMQASGSPIPESETDEAAYGARFVVGWDPVKNRRVGAPNPISGLPMPFLKPGAVRGRRFIFIDEWGPYDFLSPRLVSRSEADGRISFDVLGPKGKWRVEKLRGAQLSASSGTVPGKVSATIEPGFVGQVSIDLAYVGGKMVDHLGNERAAGRSVEFGFDRLVFPMRWNVSFFSWSVSENPNDVHAAPEPGHFAAQISGASLAKLALDRLDFSGYGWAKGVPNDRFLTVAESEFSAPPGEYLVEFVTDDGCRATLDGKPILSGAWKYQGPTSYSVKVRLGGAHRLRIEHFQIDGYAQLSCKIRPVGG